MQQLNKNLTNSVQKILALVHDKAVIDHSEDWSKGSSTYFNGIYKELEEVKIELEKDRRAHLEDELGDVFWDYLNFLQNLENEKKIDLEKVFERCAKKYTERIDGKKNGKLWNDIKKKQKKQLHEEQKLLDQ